MTACPAICTPSSATRAPTSWRPLNKRVKIAGRIMTRRIMGKASFATLQDMAGKIQVYVTRDDLPEGFYNEQFKKWGSGDIVGVEGTLFRTNTGELSVHVGEIAC